MSLPAQPTKILVTSPSTTVPQFGGPGSVITIEGGPNATANIPGPRSDPADFWGSGLVIVAILVSIAVARFVFRRPGPPAPPAEGPR
ncbi:MAG TPA: hypothetical protein VNF71_06785 [Acidimicrobiales bacterium]|nr:hypothetical protein [Acidimicrobiales bacterium]